MKLELDGALEVELERYCFDLLAPVPRLRVSEWAEKNIYLTERVTASPGRFSTVLTPYIREPLQCYADKSVTDLVLCFGTQTAKTTVIMVGTSYRIVNDPVPVLWVMPNQDLAKSFSKTRWKQMVDDCEPLKEQKPEDRHLYGNLEQHFAKVSLNFVGSNSPSNLASRPAGLLNLDETDKFKMESEREAGALQLAEERTKTFPFPLRVKTSTPTTVLGEIWREFLLGDQRYYNLPCPHCHNLIVLKFRVKSEEHGDCGLRWWKESEDEVKTEGAWDFKKVRHAAFYKCQECGGEIRDHHKPAMLRAGEWIPTNPNCEPGRRSYHLNSLYSVLGRECTFGSIAIKWLQTRGNLTKRHNFINSTLAETWDNEKAIDDTPVFMEEYGLEAVPNERTIIMSVDEQEDHRWVVIRAWAPPTEEKPSGESWQLFADKVQTKEEVEALQGQFGIEDKHVVVDMNHFAGRVSKWIVNRNWRGLWGSDKSSFSHPQETGQRVQLLWSIVQYRDPHLGSAFASPTNQPAMYVFWANDPVKDLLAVLRFSQPPIFHVSASAHEKYAKHLNAEQKVVVKQARTGRYSYHWHQFSRENHLRDCELMNLVRALQLGLVPMPDGSSAPMQGQFDLRAA